MTFSRNNRSWRNRPAFTSFSRSRWVAATIRTSTFMSRRRADRAERLPLDDAEQLRLAFEREFAHFVEEERAFVRLLEQARGGRGRRR